ncbi:TPA: GNAT family N-acetyltransferase [Candidatus Poribacteria bacterium]|nr:GNAT family N-acetyltransferase [Candidatus Poribacteria bacterium]
MGDFKVRDANLDDQSEIKRIIDGYKDVFGFIPAAAIKKGIESGEVIVAEGNSVVGFTRYHLRRDGLLVIYEIAVKPDGIGKGIGRSMVEEIERRSVNLGALAIRLKCPVDLDANGFYARMGFRRIGIERGKKRALAIWEKPIPRGFERPTKPVFFITLSGSASDIRSLVSRWNEAYRGSNVQSRVDPFAHIIFSPLTVSQSAITEIKRLREMRGSRIMFDSGGYQVQQGRMDFSELMVDLKRFYLENNWADRYILPDVVPLSTDSDEEVEFKVRDTIDYTKLFLSEMPNEIKEKAVGVIHGRRFDQVKRCVEAYTELGLKYVAFGSFSTSGPKGRVNLLSRDNVSLLRELYLFILENGLSLHILGIGNPTYLLRLKRNRIIPHSFDSSGWWKAGGYGKLFFPGGKQIHITRMKTPNSTLEGVLREKERTGHECPFCSNLLALRRDRMLRILHNLSALIETISLFEEGEDG